jgi:tetratricopeptide (TPR) repeat protein
VKDLSDIPTENIDAYGYYVAALDIINDSNKQLVIQESQHAIELLQSAVAADPNFALAWIRLAGELDWTNGEHFEPALEAQFQAALARANAINPDLPELHLVRAKYFSDRQRFNDALVELELAARGMPGNADVYRRRYWALKGLGRGEEARADLEHAMELDPRNVGVLMNYGWELRQMRRYAEARNHFARAIAAFPTVWLLRMHNAELDIVQNGDYDPLKRTWLRLDAPRDAPSYAPTVSMFAWISGDTQTALDYARRPTPSTADLENALTAAETRAWVYRAAGLDADGKASAGEALRLMQQALQEQPDDPNRILASARLSVFFGDHSNAIRVANESIEASQSEAGQRFIGAYYPDRFRMDYGRVLCSAGDLSAAENEFRRMLSKENGSTLPHLVNDWPPCKERMLGTENYLRLQKEFSHLSEGITAPMI